MSNHMLTPEEREEYDELMYEAGRPEGSPLKSDEIGPRVVEMLQDAAQAGRPWANWKLEDYLEAGALAAWKQWNKRQESIRVVFGEKLVAKPAMRSVKRRTAEAVEYWQPSMYEEMTGDELRRLIDDSVSRISAEHVNVEIARRLLKAVEDTESGTVIEAMERLGTTVESYLTEPEARAA